MCRAGRRGGGGPAWEMLTVEACVAPPHSGAGYTRPLTTSPKGGVNPLISEGHTLRHGWGCSVHKPVAKYRAMAMGFCNRRAYDIGLCTGLERRGPGYSYARGRLTRGGGG